MIAMSVLNVVLPVTPEMDCRDSRLCAAFWVLMIAGATAALLFLVELRLILRDRKRRS